METITTDWLVILIAAVLNLAIGFIWYSKWLFGPVWHKLSGIKEKDCKMNSMAFVWSFLVALVIAFFLDMFEAHLGVITVSDGMFVGFSIWLGFVATTHISSVIWGKKPFKLFAIHTGRDLLSLLVMGGVIGA